MRKSKGLSQRELAKILKTSHPTIARWETPGYTGYTLSKLIEVAEALDHSVELRFVPKDITINKIEVVDWIDRVSLTAWKNNVSLTSQIHREIDTRSDSFNVRANAVTKVRSI
jgi:transcriptional regulator with XRE-family HTH domain